MWYTTSPNSNYYLIASTLSTVVQTQIYSTGIFVVCLTQKEYDGIYLCASKSWDWKPYTAAVVILSITHDKSKFTTCCPACSSFQKFYNSILTSSHLYEHWSNCQNLCTNIINFINPWTIIQDHCKIPNYVHKYNISLIPSDYTLP